MKTMMNDLLGARISLSLCSPRRHVLTTSRPATSSSRQAWSRATPGGAKVAGGYPDHREQGHCARPAGRLVQLISPARLEVHEMTTDNGVMTMRPLDNGLAIDPGKTVKLAPGGYHLMMLQDLKGPFKQGDKVPVTLQFEKAGKVAHFARRARRRCPGAR